MRQVVDTLHIGGSVSVDVVAAPGEMAGLSGDGHFNIQYAD